MIDPDDPVRVYKVLHPYMNGLFKVLAEWLLEQEIEIGDEEGKTPIDMMPAVNRLAGHLQWKPTPRETPTLAKKTKHKINQITNHRRSR